MKVLPAKRQEAICAGKCWKDWGNKIENNLYIYVNKTTLHETEAVLSL